ncbi:PIR protein, putative [Plasmodium sp. gorilla clade G1]|nr:PIR protein, putative [Plasmodium sp. gorilla clade G1]
MKHVYFKVLLLFSLPLNILVDKKTNDYRPYTLTYTKLTNTITSSRLLCECDMYAATNYDNDPEMKKVMQQFDEHTTQRLLEYNEHMIKKRKECKEQCDKDIRKIILKDKIEKQLKEKFSSALQTDICADYLPQCTCEKYLADKVEKTCLNCGGILGGVVTPNVGVVSTIFTYLLTDTAAKHAGSLASSKVSVKVGIQTFIQQLSDMSNLHVIIGDKLVNLVTPKTVGNIVELSKTIHETLESTCFAAGGHLNGPMKIACIPDSNIFNEQHLQLQVAKIATKAAEEGAKEGALASQTAEANTWSWGTMSNFFFTNPVGIAFTTVLLIAIIILITYLILHSRKKKKMKKKLQYIKLLKE